MGDFTNEWSGGFHPRKKKKKNNTVLMFDENARREFLTGFHKRNLERRQKALEEFEKQLKIERSRIKAESKEAYRKILMMQRPVPELDLFSQEIDMDTHSVTVTEMSAAQLAKSNNWIGENQITYQKKETESIQNQSDIESDLEGMQLKPRKKESYRKTILKRCKDIKKGIMKQATLRVKNSKIFLQKSKIEKFKHIKRKKKEEKKRKKLKRQKMMGNQ
ncbi:hypothetical protein RUM44_011199 [Polyplax serrata]|uniref:Nucleolar protein 12 n=1 Tax=Polyplax serrata TaxID=468196 RepID=A0ABR1APC8_POLSC